MSRIHLRSRSLILCLSLAATGVAGVSCSSSDGSDANSVAGATSDEGGADGDGTSGGATGGSEAGATDQPPEMGMGGEAPELAGAAGMDETPEAGGHPGSSGGAAAGGASPSGGSAGKASTVDPNAAAIKSGKAVIDALMPPGRQCPTCHQADYAGLGYWPNITPDEDNGIGTWTDDEVKAAITMGKDKGTTVPLCAQMERYPFTAAQVSDVVSYLRSLKASTKKITAACPGK